MYPRGEIKTFAPYFINPSTSEAVADYSFDESAIVGSSIATNDLVIDERSAFGTFIHHLMCASRPDMSEKEIRELVTRLSSNYEIPLKDFEARLAKQVHEFFQWVQTNYHPQQIHKELPLMMEKEGQFINGIADLVIETENQVLLIDYKTFSGNEQSLRWKAQTFSGQLVIYQDILKKAFPGKEVKAAVYFIMEGRVIWMEEKKVYSSEP